MDVFDAIQQRFSVREYLDRPVEEEKLHRVLEAARLAPSGGNRQPWAFIVVRDAALRQQLTAAAKGQAFVGQAPVVLVACATDPGSVMSCQVEAYAVNVAIAVDHMTLQAVEEGLGTCWIGAFDQQAVKDLLGIPEGVKVVALLPLGYPAVSPPAAKSRRSQDEIVMYDRWRE